MNKHDVSMKLNDISVASVPKSKKRKHQDNDGVQDIQPKQHISSTSRSGQSPIMSTSQTFSSSTPSQYSYDMMMSKRPNNTNTIRNKLTAAEQADELEDTSNTYSASTNSSTSETSSYLDSTSSNATSTTTNSSSSSNNDSNSSSTCSICNRNTALQNIANDRASARANNNSSSNHQPDFHQMIEILSKPSDNVKYPSYNRVQKKIQYCKLKHRTSLTLEAWRRYNFRFVFPRWKQEIYQKISRRNNTQTAKALPSDDGSSRPSSTVAFPNHQSSYVNANLQLTQPAVISDAAASSANSNTINAFDQTNLIDFDIDTSMSKDVDHVHCSQLSVSEFIAHYESKHRPVMISGLTDKWKARFYTPESLTHSCYYRVPYKCGELDDGTTSLKIKLKYFLEYMKNDSDNDDSPLYIFDTSFDDHPRGKKMLNDFEVPEYFRDDLFHLVGNDRRPPFRWFLVGPQRSGSNVHQDPLGTSAWNSLLFGSKLWILFSPNAKKSLVNGKYLRKSTEDNEAITYFVKILPRIKAEICNKKLDVEIIEFIQYPGQTVFIPQQWWHSVLNLEHSIAITQNFASNSNFDLVWRLTRQSRKHMCKRWFDQLAIHHPQLALRATELNRSDQFDFKFSTKSK